MGLQQDNHPKHTARNVKMWCLFHCKQQLHTPQSPDINVIEHLWTTLETAVQKHQIRNKAHLKQVLQEEWDKISPDTTKKLVESVPRHLGDIIKAKGHMQPNIDTVFVCDMSHKFHWCILNFLRSSTEVQGTIFQGTGEALANLSTSTLISIPLCAGTQMNVGIELFGDSLAKLNLNFKLSYWIFY
ncbi:transposable element Tcb1 transposase [Trichonephila clavipes]|uniref:Transposable element Tcb1 transposase n=1 Tax=Trichonephila clavipes TaxID=2585209 RepID=A0A8X6RAK2_TRICX|nr:transposable element Tcb1 transposase [Trichonephila clavipes]